MKIICNCGKEVNDIDSYCDEVYIYSCKCEKRYQVHIEREDE